MILHKVRESVKKQLAGTIRLKLALIVMVAAFVALPQMFSASAGTEPPAPQGVLFTVTTTDDHNDFSCDGTDCTLREAIQAANNAATADTIDFSVTGTINLMTALPDISDAVQIIGPGAKSLTIKRNDSAGDLRIFTVTTAGTVTFNGLTISNGNMFPTGGGIQNSGTGTVNVSNSTISGNTGRGGGGGIFNNSTGTITVTNSIISGNDGGRGSGGGINNRSTGTVNVTDSTISGNTTVRGDGGGICNSGAGIVTVTNSTISGNLSGENEGDGGGISNAGTGTTKVTGSTITGNKAGESGGGIDNTGTGTVIVINSTISGNEATLSGSGSSSDHAGGGLSNDGGTVTVTNSTIRNNIASGRGGGIRNLTGIVNVTDTTISNHTAGGGGGISNETGTVNITGSTINGNDGGRASGGGILNIDTGTVNITNSTISHNFLVRGVGGGIVNGFMSIINITNSTVSGNFINVGDGAGITNDSTSIVNIKNSLVTLNSAEQHPDVLGTFASQGFNLIGKVDGGTGFVAPTDITGTIASPVDPNLETDDMGQPLLKDNGGPTQTIALLCGSPAIDKGTHIGINDPLTTDQRGFSRTVDDSLIANASGGDGTDIGAFELNTQNCNHPPVAQCRNIQVSAGGNCQASITAAQIDNGSFDPDPGDSIASRTLDNSGPFALGTHTVTLTVTDTHNAMSSCMATVTVVDTTPPTITCPANIIIQTSNAGNTTVVVNYPPPATSDNCAGVTVVCSPPSGSSFPLGATTVTCTASDVAGNTASCSFTVTVFDVCVQDDASRDTLLFNSQTGDYLYRRCGTGGFSFSGRGSVRVQSSLFILEHNALDRRIMGRIDKGQKKGTASVQTFNPQATYTIADRNTADNTCACP